MAAWPPTTYGAVFDWLKSLQPPVQLDPAGNRGERFVGTRADPHSLLLGHVVFDIPQGNLDSNISAQKLEEVRTEFNVTPQALRAFLAARQVDCDDCSEAGS